MAGNSALAFLEGSSTNRPPLFDGNNYNAWKNRFKIYVCSIDYSLWHIFEEGPYVPMKIIDGIQVPKPDRELNEVESKEMTRNYKAMNILSCALDQDEYNRVRGSKSAHTMWKVLEDEEGSGDEEEDENANVCFMAFGNEVHPSPSISNSYDDDDNDEDDPNQLLCDMYDQLKKCAKQNKDMKLKIESLLEERSRLSSENKKICDEVDCLKIENEKLIATCNTSSLKYLEAYDKVSSLECKLVEFDSLKNKVVELTLLVDKFSKGSKDLDHILGMQCASHDKHGLGYIANHVGIASSSHIPKNHVVNARTPHRPNRSVKHVHKSFEPSICCTYCGKYGHTCVRCHVKKKIERGVKTIWRVKRTLTRYQKSL